LNKEKYFFSHEINYKHFLNEIFTSAKKESKGLSNPTEGYNLTFYKNLIQNTQKSIQAINRTKEVLKIE